MRVAAEVMVRAGKAYGADSCSVFAGGVTYYALMSLFPLTLFALSIAGFVYADEADQQRLVDNLLDTMPIDDDTGREDLENVISNVVDARGALGIIGLLGSGYAASALFGAVRKALNVVFQVEKKRNFALAKGVDVLSVIFFASLLLLSVAVTFALTLVRQSSEELLGGQVAALVGRVLNLALALVPVFVSGLVFFLLFRLVPARRLNTKSVLWGALAAAALFEALKLGFSYYATNFGNFNATYGTIGFVIILLVFFNFSAQIMLLGAEIARARWDLDNDESGRFRETAGLAEKARGLLGKVPFLRGRFPPHEEAQPAGEALARDRVEAAPLVFATYAAALPSEVAATSAGLPVETARPESEAGRSRPAAWSSLLVAVSALAALVALLRRR